MEIHQDYKELLELLNAHNVKYVIVGAYALAFHGLPRYTGDLDILIGCDENNAEKVATVLQDFGFSSLNITKEDLMEPDIVIQLGYPPLRIDLITSITGVSWDEVYNNAVTGNYGDVKVLFIGKQQFIKNKKALGRYQDLADLESIGYKNEDADSP
ncbi:MAG: nucleotidyltransferase family protein [Spirochaetes bacterium]|nr:hypothetical protein [Spirochaetota bacterium]NMB66428.1 nucleotidyltransferase family protein [Spirochaetota bacterium]